MTTSKSASPSSKKKKLLSINIISITKSGGHKYSISFQDILYQLGITTEDDNSIISSKHEYIELPKYFPKPNNFLLLSRYMVFKKVKQLAFCWNIHNNYSTTYQPTISNDNSLSL